MEWESESSKLMVVVSTGRVFTCPVKVFRFGMGIPKLARGFVNTLSIVFKKQFL